MTTSDDRPRLVTRADSNIKLAVSSQVDEIPYFLPGMIVCTREGNGTDGKY